MKKVTFLSLTIIIISLSWAADTGKFPIKVPLSESNRSFELTPRVSIVGKNITRTRAYFGAPPPVPHTIQFDRGSDWCLTCHAKENRVKYRHKAIAPTPHKEYTQCMQCHVKKDDDITPWKENNFVGLDFPGKGSRAHDFAPPTIPHKTFMRENCSSCHGPKGEHAIRTPHPYRSQCQQCHVAELSQDYTRPPLGK